MAMLCDSGLEYILLGKSVETKSAGKRYSATPGSELCSNGFRRGLVCAILKMESFPVGVWKLVCENLPAPCVLRLVRVNRKLSGLEHLPLNWCHHEEYKIGDYVDTKRTIERAKELSRFRWTGLRVLECDDGDLQQVPRAYPRPRLDYPGPVLHLLF